MNFLFGTLLVMFALLLVRLGKLQLVDAHAYRVEAAHRHDGAWHFTPRRGRLLDRHGYTLAEPKPARRLGIDPSQVRDPRTFSLVLSDYLGGVPRPWEIHEVLRKAHAWAKQHGKPLPQYRVLLPYADDSALVERIDDLARLPANRKLRLGLYGVVVHPEEGRHDPNGSYAAHVLGQMPHGDECRGTGAEQAFDAVLNGTSQSMALYRDGRRRAYAKAGLAARLQTSGGDARLTIDITVQHVLEQALDALAARWSPQAACGIVLDPRSGDVLALANRPTFDPNRQAANTNLAIQGLFEPGSFFKPFTVACALAQGVVQADEILPMPISVVLAHEQKAIGDAHRVGRGTVTRLIAHSSNTGAALLGDRLGCERMRALFLRTFPDRQHGTDCGLPYERGARVALPRQDQSWPWWLAHRAAFGQGFRVTPLQMAASFAAFARPDGRGVQPRFFLDDDRPAATRIQVCRPVDLPVVRQGLEQCVSEGTARHAFADAPFTAGAKTATSEQWGTVEGRRVLWNICSLAAYAPAHDPQVVVLILAQVPDDAHGFGGTVAGPHVRRVLERVLRYWNLSPARMTPVLAAAEGGR